MGAVREVFVPSWLYRLPVVARGKVLGGSSAVNFLVWTSPAKEDIDGIFGNFYQFHMSNFDTDWEKLGNVGWNWESFSKALSKTIS